MAAQAVRAEVAEVGATAEIAMRLVSPVVLPLHLTLVVLTLLAPQVTGAIVETVV